VSVPMLKLQTNLLYRLRTFHTLNSRPCLTHTSRWIHRRQVSLRHLSINQLSQNMFRD